MKKILSLFLSILLIFTCAVPAFAATRAENIPTIMLRGDGTQIYVPDETAPGGERNVWDDAFDGIETSDIVESVSNVLLPFLTEGLLFDKWDNYYDAFYEEIAPIFDELRLDGDGNPRYNSTIGKDEIAENARKRNQNLVNFNGTYSLHSYTYWYDWRLSPFDMIDDFHSYILGVMKATKKSKVNLYANCLGGSYLLAYLEKYGDEGHISKVFFNATVGNGTAVLTDAFCGDIELDDKAIQRFLHQNVSMEDSSFFGLFSTTPLINEIVFTSYDLLAQTGVIDSLGLTFDDLYQKIYEGLVPRLAIAIYASMPGYWTTIETDRYEEARSFVFGKSGDKLYDEYAGVVAKNDEYYNTVSSKKLEIIEKCQAKGIYFGALAKYGTQMYPFVERQHELSDELVDLKNSSFGATTSKNVFSKFSDSYIENAKAKGTDKYISPDRQVDASTSLFKDTLWVLKNVGHECNATDDQIATRFFLYDNFTVNSATAYPQYMIYIPGTMEWDEESGEYDDDTGDIVPMTEENCELTLWDEMHEDSKKEPTVISTLMAFFRWLTTMFRYFTGLFSKSPSE